MLISGPAATLPSRIDHPLAVGLDRDPDAPALEDLRTSISWRELAQCAESLAAGYASLGLNAGDRIASLMPNRVELVIHYLACLSLGLVATPLNYRYVVPEIDHALRISGAVALLYHGERRADLEATELAGGLPLGLIRFDDDIGAPADGARDLVALMRFPAADSVVPALPEEAPAIIYFTSGSTGKPKGVTHSRASYGAALAILAQSMEYVPGERLLVGCSLAHAAASMFGLAALSVGTTLVVATESDNHGIEALLHHRRPEVLLMLPAPLMALMDDTQLDPADFSYVRLCLSGGDKVPLQLQRKFRAAVGFSIDECFGMSECGVATVSPPSGENRVGSVGRVCPGFSCSIRDEQGHEQPVGAEGRLWLRSPAVMTGYWANPQATAEALVEGWLDTGDEMRLDGDGYLWFCGRRKQIIVHDGSNICPQDVEDALCEHPWVALAGVIGIHNLMHGEIVRAYITLHPGCEAPSAGELMAFARERIGYKAPEEIVVLEEMPLNVTGKVDRIGLKRMAAEAMT